MSNDRIPLNVSVHIIEARDLAGKNWNGLSDPLVRVTVAGRRQHTDIRHNQLSATWNQVFQFHQLSLSPDEYIREHVLIQVFDANTFVRNELLGQFALSLEKVRSKGDPTPHQIFRQWLVLSHPKEPSKEQGYLLATVTVLGPGDSPPSHSIQEEFANAIESSLSLEEDLGESPLRAPEVKRRGYNFSVKIFHGEHLPSTDIWGNCDPFIVVKFNGISMRTPVKRQTREPKWNQTLTLPVHTPCFSEVVELQLWDYRRASPDVQLATCTVRFSDILRESIPPTWFNFYGFPISEKNVGSHWVCEGPRRSQAEAHSYLGRCLISLSANLVEKPTMEQSPCKPAQSAENETYLLWIDLYKGQELPVDFGGSALVEMNFGPESHIRRTKWCKRTRSQVHHSSQSERKTEEYMEKDVARNSDDLAETGTSLSFHSGYLYDFEPQPKYAAAPDFELNSAHSSTSGGQVCRFGAIEVLLPTLDLKHLTSHAHRQLFDLVITVYSKAIMGGADKVAFLRIPGIELLKQRHPEWHSLMALKSPTKSLATPGSAGALLLNATLTPTKAAIPRPVPVCLDTHAKFQIRAHVYQARNLNLDPKLTLEPMCFVQVKLGQVVASRQITYQGLTRQMADAHTSAGTREVEGLSDPVWYETLLIRNISMPEELSLVPDLQIQVFDSSTRSALFGETLLGECQFPVALATQENWPLDAPPKWFSLHQSQRTAAQSSSITKMLRGANLPMDGVMVDESSKDNDDEMQGAILLKLEVLPLEEAKVKPWYLHLWPKVSTKKVSLGTIGLRNLGKLESVHGALSSPFVRLSAQSIPNVHELMIRLARAARTMTIQGAQANSKAHWTGGTRREPSGTNSALADSSDIWQLLSVHAVPLSAELETIEEGTGASNILKNLSQSEVELLGILVNRLKEVQSGGSLDQLAISGNDAAYSVYPAPSLPPMMFIKSDSAKDSAGKLPGDPKGVGVSVWSNVEYYYGNRLRKHRKSSYDSTNLGQAQEWQTNEQKEGVDGSEEWMSVGNASQEKEESSSHHGPRVTFFNVGDIIVQTPIHPYYASNVHISLLNLRKRTFQSSVAHLLGFTSVSMRDIPGQNVFEFCKQSVLQRHLTPLPMTCLSSRNGGREELLSALKEGISNSGNIPKNANDIGRHGESKDEWDETSQDSDMIAREHEFPAEELDTNFGHCSVLDIAVCNGSTDLALLNDSFEELSAVSEEDCEVQVTNENFATLWPDDLAVSSQQRVEKGIYLEPLEEANSINPLPYQCFFLAGGGHVQSTFGSIQAHLPDLKVGAAFKGVLAIQDLHAVSADDDTRSAPQEQDGPFWFLQGTDVARPDRYPPLYLSQQPHARDDVVQVKERPGSIPPMREMESGSQHLRVRVYVVGASGLSQPARGTIKQLNPYLVVRMDVPVRLSGRKGTFYISDRVNFKSNVTDPFFGAVYELDVYLPEISILELQVWNCNVFSDDLLGSTKIDLEDRWFNPLWHKQRTEGKRLNEFRPLWHSSSEVSQGKLETWVEIYTPREALDTPLADIRPPPPSTWELRVVLWETRRVSMLEGHRYLDLFVDGHLSYERSNGDWVTDQWLQSETVVNVRDGRAILNWRMKFELEVPCKFPKLMLNLQHENFIASNEFIGELVLPLQSLCRSATSTSKEVLRRPRTWFRLGGGELKGRSTGEIELEISLVKDSYAERLPVGQGREKPNREPFLEEPPKRTTWTTMLRQFTFGRVFCMLCCLGIPILVALIILS